MRPAVVGATFAVAAFATVAGAAWLAQATGQSGYGKAGAQAAMTTEYVQASAPIFPGGTADLEFSFLSSGPNPTAKVTTVETAGYTHNVDLMTTFNAAGL
jgi:hypothetical protein